MPLQRSTKTIEKNGDVVYYYNDPPATVHLVIGTGGAFFSKNAVDPPPSWNENYFYEYGYARVKAFDASRLEYEWINSDSMEVMDRFVITKSKSTPDSSSENALGTEAVGIITAFTVAGFIALVVFSSFLFLFLRFTVNCKCIFYFILIMYQAFLYYQYYRKKPQTRSNSSSTEIRAISTNSGRAFSTISNNPLLENKDKDQPQVNASGTLTSLL